MGKGLTWGRGLAYRERGGAMSMAGERTTHGYVPMHGNLYRLQGDSNCNAYNIGVLRMGKWWSLMGRLQRGVWRLGKCLIGAMYIT